MFDVSLRFNHITSRDSVATFFNEMTMTVRPKKEVSFFTAECRCRKVRSYTIARRFIATMFKVVENTFLYFAYGSNLLKRRIRINNPSAKFLGIGRLDDHLLDFIAYSENWRGASATIVPTPDAHVWGAIWRLNNDDMPALDKQEGVDTNWYFAKTVKIVLPDGSSTECRTYQQTINPPIRKKGEELPLERRPCITYIHCIVTGAIECKIPEDYVEELKKIPNNGQVASPKMLEMLQINL